MSQTSQDGLSRRERQIMDILYRFGRVTAGEVLENLPEPPSYSAVRAMLRVLEEKGHIKHLQDGPRYLYVPTLGVEKARKSALRHMLQTFFDGSTEQAVAALLDLSKPEMSEQELERLSTLIHEAKKEGR